MAAVSPSPGSVPSGVTSSTPPSTTPPLASATPPLASATPPLASATPPPVPSTSGIQPNANPPENSSPSLPSPLPNALPPTDSGGNPAAPPPTESAPPPTQSAPPPSPPVLPPTPVTPLTPPPIAAPPPVPSVSPPPPQVVSPASPPPPEKAPPPSPPTGSPPVPTPPPAVSPPPTSSPTPPASSSPPPPPPSPNPPADPPPPSSSKPPEHSPSPPASTPPKKSPPPPAASPPKGSPPSSGGSLPPSDPGFSPPPSVIPGTPAPIVQAPPSPSLSPPGNPTAVPSTPSIPGNKSGGDASETANVAPSKGGIGSGGAVAIGVVSGVLVLGLIGLLILWAIKRRKKSSGATGGHVIPASMGSSPRSDIKLFGKGQYPPSHFGGGSGTNTPTDHGGFGQSRSFFTYPELLEATGGFSDENLLGEGGFGCVYKGLLVDGRVVAVKQLKIGGGQGEREFRAEVETISRIHHRHLVSLVGYCIWESKRLLVYEYVPNDTLHFHLHGEGRRAMDWATRVKVAAGAARGIAYLHEDCHPRIIHRDIKSSNILLDDKYEARVSDFGLAKLAMDADTHVSTRVMGTFGYLAPEYATTGKLTEKSDVYSFGVVLLELVTGRRPVDKSRPLGDESLVEWARPLLTHALDTQTFEGLVDPRLEKNYIDTEMFRMIEVAAACVRHSASKRPRMGQVVRALTISDSGDLSNGLRVGESQLYDSAQQSAEIRWFRRMAFGSQDSNFDMFSQSSQSHGFSTQSRQNVYSSMQHGQGSNAMRHSQGSQSLGFSGQSGSTVNFSAEHGFDGNVSRQVSNNLYLSAQRSQNVEVSHEGCQNPNVYRQDSPNR